MSEKAKQFLIELSKDPVQMEDFLKNPDALLASADLTVEEKDVLRSGDPARVRALVGDLSYLGVWVIPPPQTTVTKPPSRS